jgi:HSP20 family protein
MATTLTRWDPAAELAGVRQLFDRFFDQGFGRFPSLRPNGEDFGSQSLALDVYETNDELVVKAAVPGVDPKDVDIEVDDDVLTIRGEYAKKDEGSEGGYHRRELHWGKFERAMRLPPTIDAGKAQARFEHGMLTLTLPKKEEARARTLKITPQGVIEGQAKSE